jgi:hypothetical protein
MFSYVYGEIDRIRRNRRIGISSGSMSSRSQGYPHMYPRDIGCIQGYFAIVIRGK